MIISRVQLTRKPGTQGSLAKVLLDGAAKDQSHGLVWSLFSEAEREKRDFLYRDAGDGSFIVVSEREPADPHGLWHVEPNKYEPVLAVGDRLRFILRANPAISIFKRGSKRGVRVDAIMHAKSKLETEQRKRFSAVEAEAVALDWLEKRGLAIGASFERARCTATGYRQVRIPKTDRKEPIEFSEINFEGVLSVTNPEKLKAALFKGEGLGKAKAFGCGLMLIRRI